MAYENLKSYINHTYPHLADILTEKQYEQLDWIDTTQQTNERVPVTSSEPKVHLQQQRIFARLHFLYLLRQGDDASYTRFINGQNQPQLTAEHFSQLSTPIKKLTNIEYQQLWVATLVSKSPEANKRATLTLHAEPPFDSVDFMALVMTQAPQLYPAAAELLAQDQTAKHGFSAMFNTGHFRHMLYVEGGHNMFSKLLSKIQNGEITQQGLNLWLAYWLIDITGFRAQTKELGSEYLNDNTFKAVTTLQYHLNELLKNPQYPILYNYLADRAHWLGLIDSPTTPNNLEIPNLILARIAAMQRLFTPEEKNGMQHGLAQLEAKVGSAAYTKLIAALNPLQTMDEPTPTYGPALLANLRAECNYEQAITIGLPIYADALSLYRKLRADRIIDQSIPLNLNGLAKTDTVKALVSGEYFTPSINPSNGTTTLQPIQKQNALAFFVSSAGDTDLAKSTIEKLIEQDSKNTIFVIPLTTTAADRTKSMTGIKHVSLADITNQTNMLSQKQINQEDLAKISAFVANNNIVRAYIGVPSPIDEEIPYQIANQLNIPCTVAYEFMFKPENHSFWKHAKTLAAKKNCDFATPLKSASQDILALDPTARVHEIGHLCIDRSFATNAASHTSVKSSLLIKETDELIFISGTTQPTQIDNDFLTALLSELSTGKHPHIQIRFGLHPGIKELDSYLNTLLATCNNYPMTADQFKFILPEQLEKRLQNIPFLDHPFILRANISGPDATQAADKIAQAVPGALLNESALRGKPSYFHDQTVRPYLPTSWFATTISALFSAKPAPSRAIKTELELQESAPNRCAELMSH